jgi:hypothetical protein
MFHAYGFIGRSLQGAKERMQSLLAEKYSQDGRFDHPDILVLEKDDDYKADGIKRAIAFLQTTSNSGNGKTLVVWDAGKLNTTSQNRLLKSVEEPPMGGLFLFHANRVDDLLETLQSRMHVESLREVGYQEFKSQHPHLTGDTLLVSFFADFLVDDLPKDAFLEDIVEMTKPYYEKSLYFEKRYSDLDSFRSFLSLVVKMIRYTDILGDAEVIDEIEKGGVFLEWVTAFHENTLVQRLQKYDILVSVLSEVQKGNSLSLLREKVLMTI